MSFLLEICLFINFYQLWSHNNS